MGKQFTIPTLEESIAIYNKCTLKDDNRCLGVHFAHLDDYDEVDFIDSILDEPICDQDLIDAVI